MPDDPPTASPSSEEEGDHTESEPPPLPRMAHKALRAMIGRADDGSRRSDDPDVDTPS